MKYSENSSAKPSQPLPSWLIWGFIIFSFSGFLDATYLTVSHYMGTELNCTILNGCGTVTASEYSLIAGIPVALLGCFFYLTMLIGSLVYLDTRHEAQRSASNSLNEFALKLISWLPFTGLAASAWFVYLQFFVIKALCQYCMLSAITSSLLFILAVITLVKSNSKKL